jgi:hypothetical protein
MSQLSILCVLALLSKHGPFRAGEKAIVCEFVENQNLFIGRTEKDELLGEHNWDASTQTNFSVSSPK